MPKSWLEKTMDEIHASVPDEAWEKPRKIVYTIDELREIANRGRLQPDSLTGDEIRALCLFVKRPAEQQ